MKWKRDKGEHVPTKVEKRVAMLANTELVNAAESTIYVLGRAVHQGEWDEADLAIETLDALLGRLRKL